MLEKLCALLANQFGVDPDTVTADTSFEEDLSSIVTVGDLYRYMREHLDL